HPDHRILTEPITRDVDNRNNDYNSQRAAKPAGAICSAQNGFALLAGNIPLTIDVQRIGFQQRAAPDFFASYPIFPLIDMSMPYCTHQGSSVGAQHVAPYKNIFATEQYVYHSAFRGGWYGKARLPTVMHLCPDILAVNLADFHHLNFGEWRQIGHAEILLHLS